MSITAGIDDLTCHTKHGTPTWPTDGAVTKNSRGLKSSPQCLQPVLLLREQVLAGSFPPDIYCNREGMVTRLPTVFHQQEMHFGGHFRVEVPSGCSSQRGNSRTMVNAALRRLRACRVKWSSKLHIPSSMGAKYFIRTGCESIPPISKLRWVAFARRIVSSILSPTPGYDKSTISVTNNAQPGEHFIISGIVAIIIVYLRWTVWNTYKYGLRWLANQEYVSSKFLHICETFSVTSDVLDILLFILQFWTFASKRYKYLHFKNVKYTFLGTVW